MFLVLSCSSDEPGYSGGERGFDQEQIDGLNESDKYDYDKTIEPYSNPILNFFGKLFASIFQLFGYSLTYIIIGLVLAAVIFIIIRSNKAKLILPSKETGADVKIINAEDLEQTDYRKLLDLALSKSDFRLAIRFTFLIALQHLQLRKKINWHKEKTNYQYLYELSPELQLPFSNLTRIYEYVWYGEAEVSKELFQSINTYYQHLKKLQP